MSFFGELKRRNVIRVALLYVVASWLILQVADVLFPNLGAPDWAFGLVLGLLLLFFVPVLIFSWVYEITPDGLKKTSELEPDAPAAAHPGQRMNVVIVVLLVLAIAGLVLDRMFPETEPGRGTPATARLEGAEGTTANEPGRLSEGSATQIGAEPSVAVLPFATRSDERQDEYFAAGIHDDLLTQLAKVEGLKVISRTSVMQYANTTKTMREIAQELGVATVLEGSVQRAGDRIRVNAQLIDARTDEHLWAEFYDEELSVANIFSIQSRLATAIAGALEAELSPGVQARIDNQPTASLEAWELELRGRYLLDKEQNRPNLEGAVDLFRRAIEQDPAYAMAWAGLAQGISELVGWFYWSDEALGEAWLAADKAIELDADLAQGYFARGDLLRIERRFREGEEAFLKGLALSPGSADGHSRYGDILRDAGRFEESVRESRRAVELDPRMVRIRVSLLQNLYFSRDWDSVLEQAAAVLQMEPDTAEAWYWIGLAETWKGNLDAGVDAALKAVALDPDTPYLEAGVAFIHAMGGEDERARELLENAEAHGWPLAEIGLVYGWLGDLDTAYDYMDRALAESTSGLHYLAADPGADPLRADPRWPDLLTKLSPE